jgi:hypothetical protein
MKKILLNKGKFAIVDDEDYPYLSRFNWFCDCNGFAARDIRHRDHKNMQSKARIYMEQLLIEGRGGSTIAHRNLNKLDNRKSNLILVHLRVKTHRHKKNPNTSSIYKGVSWDKVNKKWRAMIKFDGRQHSLGRFDEEKKAALEYNLKARELYGEVAYQNKI